MKRNAHKKVKEFVTEKYRVCRQKTIGLLTASIVMSPLFIVSYYISRCGSVDNETRLKRIKLYQEDRTRLLDALTPYVERYDGLEGLSVEDMVYFVNQTHVSNKTLAHVLSSYKTEELYSGGK